MEKLTLEQLKEKGAIYFEQIETGFVRYQNRIMEGSEKELRKYLQGKIKENGWEASFVDFYYGRLSAAEKEKVREYLTEEQKEYLDGQELGAEDIYFKLSEELFEIAFLLSIKEALFSTFYFTGDVCTVWSNYGRRFVVFE